MKKRIIPFIIFLLVLQIFQFGGCDLVDYTAQPPTNPLDPASDTFNPEPVSGITVYPETLNMTTGENAQLTAELVPAWATDRTVNWLSGDDNIATVDSSGLVSSTSPGFVTISAASEDGGYTDLCFITVNPLQTAIRAESVTLNKEVTSIYPNSTEQLTASVNPSNATYTSVTWTSTDENIAMVSDTGLVTGVAAGTVSIIVTTVDGGFTDMCSVEVQTTSVAVESVTLNKETTTILVNGTEQLTATISPENASNKAVTWNTENSDFLTVSENGLITGVAVGEVNITVTSQDGSYTDTCVVTVTATEVLVTGVTLDTHSITLLEGDSRTLLPTVSPSNATNQNVTWNSNLTDIASVSTEGVVTAAAAGTALITVTTTDNSHTDTCDVEVIPVPQPVTGFNALAGDGEINLSWNNPTALDHVEIWGSTTSPPTSPGSGSSIYTGFGVTAPHTPLTNGTKYYYSIFVFDEYENYSTRETDDAVPVGIPAGITAGFGVTSIDIEWGASSGGAENYELQRSTTNEVGSYSNIYTGPNLWYSHEGLSTGVTYWYQVRATNYSGASGYTTPDSGSTDNAPTIPGTPSLSLNPSSPETEIDISWTASTDVDYYEIQRSVDGSSWSTLNIDPPISTISHTDTGLAPDTTYVYQVRALNIYGASTYSAASSIKTDPLYIYVATPENDGDDGTGLGTRTSPYATIGKGIEAAAAGGIERVCVQQGTYNVSTEDSTTITIAPNVSLYGGYNLSWVRDFATPTLIQDTSTSASDWNTPNRAIEAISNTIDENTVIDGFTIRGTSSTLCTSAVKLSDASPTFSNNIIYGGEGTERCYGIFLSSSFAVITSNTIDAGDCSSDVDATSHGLYVYLSNPIIHGNSINGGISQNSSTGISLMYASHPVIFNNLIHGGTSAEASGIYIQLHNGPNYAQIYNNTINAGDSDTSSYGVKIVNSYGVFVIVVNNLIYSENKPNSFGISEDGDNDDIAELRYNCFSGLETIFYNYEGGPTSINVIGDVNALSLTYSDNTDETVEFVTEYSDLHLALGTDIPIRYGALDLSTDTHGDPAVNNLTSLADHYNFDTDYDVDRDLEDPPVSRPAGSWSMGAYQY